VDFNSPGDLIRLSGAYWAGCALQAGVVLDVFSLIGPENLTAGEVAARAEADARAMDMLLGALTALGLLIKADGRYSLTPAAQKFLVTDAPGYVGHIISHHHHLMPSWARLPEAIKTGQAVRTRVPGDDQWRESFLLGMFNMAMAIAPQLSRTLDLAGRRHLLDVGGGPGTYAIQFCLANPDLRATVFDLPPSEPFFRRTAERFGVGDRVDFQGGDYIEGEIAGSYDVAWLSQILHGENAERCALIIGKAVGALEPGGLILVQEFVLNDSRDGPLHPALFSLNMLLGTDGGQAYSEAEIKAMLTAAGARDVRRLDFTGPNDTGIIAGAV
jgi:SAM-dependent methyltransferase